MTEGALSSPGLPTSKPAPPPLGHPLSLSLKAVELWDSAVIEKPSPFIHPSIRHALLSHLAADVHT